MAAEYARCCTAPGPSHLDRSTGGRSPLSKSSSGIVRTFDFSVLPGDVVRLYPRSCPDFKNLCVRLHHDDSRLPFSSRFPGSQEGMSTAG